MWIPAGERIQPGAQDNVLPNSGSDEFGEFIFGKAAADRHESTEGGSEALLAQQLFGSNSCRNLRPDDKERQRVFKDPRLVQNLVLRPPYRYAPGSPTGNGIEQLLLAGGFRLHLT